MKTSTNQFKILITYMEQHGDLNKHSNSACSKKRIETIQRWESLTSLLNSDNSGEKKGTDKWKKVWSDFKNNTKKKAARLHRQATSSGPTSCGKNVRLSDLELRVLNLIGAQVPTGAVIEAGLAEVEDIKPNKRCLRQIDNEEIQEAQETSNQLGRCSRNLVDPLEGVLEEVVEDEVEEEVLEDDETTEGSEDSNQSPVLSDAATPSPEQQPDKTSSTTKYRGRETPPRLTRSPRRLSRRTYDVPNDSEWREFKMQQHNDTMEIKREENRIRKMEHRDTMLMRREEITIREMEHRGPMHLRREENKMRAREHKATMEMRREENRIREMEHRDTMVIRREENRIREMQVQVQREWQAIGLRALDILDKLVTKFCSDRT